MSENLVIERSIVVAASLERVWRAITEPRHFSKWFGGEISFERLAVGQEMLFKAGGETGPGTILTVEPPERFAFSWTAEPGYDERTTVSFYLEPVTEGTRITITEQGFEALPGKLRRNRFELNGQGWSIQVNNIAAYLKEDKDLAQ